LKTFLSDGLGAVPQETIIATQMPQKILVIIRRISSGILFLHKLGRKLDKQIICLF
jgi:hypothetical protein